MKQIEVEKIRQEVREAFKPEAVGYILWAATITRVMMQIVENHKGVMALGFTMDGGNGAVKIIAKQDFRDVRELIGGHEYSEGTPISNDVPLAGGKTPDSVKQLDMEKQVNSQISPDHYGDLLAQKPDVTLSARLVLAAWELGPGDDDDSKVRAGLGMIAVGMKLESGLDVLAA
jgi:hypothetical protein